MPIHIRGNIGDVAPYVLLPGDPNRAKFVAETFLENPKRYTEHRGMLGYTGTYKNIPVSVQTTMMGCPSAAITVEELAMLGAKLLIRIGTCGGTSPNLAPADLVIAQAVLARDGTTRQYLGEGNHTPIADYRIVRALEQASEGSPHHVGLVASDDSFYGVSAEQARNLYTTRGVLGLEMESSAIFTVAHLRGLEAGAIMAVSNYIGDESLVPDEVLKAGVTNMIKTALEAIVRLEQEKTLRQM